MIGAGEQRAPLELAGIAAVGGFATADDGNWGRNELVRYRADVLQTRG